MQVFYLHICAPLAHLLCVDMVQEDTEFPGTEVMDI